MSRAGGGADNPRYVGANIDGRLYDYLVKESKRTGFNKRHILERALYRDWERIHGEKKETDLKIQKSIKICLQEVAVALH